MAIDYELVRQVLMEAERVADDSHGTSRPLAVEGYDTHRIAWHVFYMKERGLIEASVLVLQEVAGAMRYSDPRLLGITWSGAEMLTTMNTPGVWQSFKEKLTAGGGSLTLEVAKSVLSGLASRAIGLGS